MECCDPLRVPIAVDFLLVVATVILAPALLGLAPFTALLVDEIDFAFVVPWAGKIVARWSSAA